MSRSTPKLPSFSKKTLQAVLVAASTLVPAFTALNAAEVEVTRTDSGTKVIASDASSTIKIIDGTGSTVADITIADNVTDVDSITNTATGGDATISIGSGKTLRLAADGAITIGAGAGNLILTGGTLTAGGATDTAGVITFTNPTSGIITVGSTIADNGTGVVGITKAGDGILILSQVQTYTGSTAINAGTIKLAVDNTFSASSLNFEAASSLDIGATSQTIREINSASAINANYTANITGTGKLTVTGNLAVGGATPTLASNVTLDLSAISEFVFNNSAGILSVGNQYAATSSDGSANYKARTGTLTLAPLSTITASALNIQTKNSIAGSTAYASTIGAVGTLNLGKNTTINADTINLATSGRDDGFINYNAATTDAFLKIRGTAGTDDSRANIKMGGHSTTGGPNAQTVSIDLVSNITGNSSLDAKIGTLTIGDFGRGYSAKVQTASFIMGNGILDATTIYVGMRTGDGTTNNAGGLNSLFSVTEGTVVADSIIVGTLATTSGTALHSTSKTNESVFTADNANIQVKTLTIGTNNNTGTSNFLTSIVNLNNGTTLAAQTIEAGTNVATRTFNWNGGTITNYDTSTDLSIASELTLTLGGAGITHTFSIDNGRTGTVDATISGEGNMVKTGEGELTLSAAEYIGTTRVEGGRLILSNATLPQISQLEMLDGASIKLGSGTSTLSLSNSNTSFAGHSTGTVTDIDGSLSLSGGHKLNIGTATGFET
ncbi:MAG: autotransporter-associated beta strand repeat-containing protein, partial [Puniceicoccales bacterium]|nr:autotransporter-associated beta strand repeat-containing protein [Puniceicoccales bacterium]